MKGDRILFGRIVILQCMKMKNILRGTEHALAMAAIASFAPRPMTWSKKMGTDTDHSFLLLSVPAGENKIIQMEWTRMTGDSFYYYPIMANILLLVLFSLLGSTSLSPLSVR